MIYLPEEKQPKPYYTNCNKPVGVINIKDSLVDITDPCYEKDTWCAFFEHKVKAGKYRCYVSVVNFPAKYQFEAKDWEVLCGKKKVGQTTTKTDRRIVELIIVHESIKLEDIKSWDKVGKIGVDAGMCGFYNHKPDFTDDNKWLEFCDSLKTFPRLQVRCDIKSYGITVSSGFGDGYYQCSEHIVDKEPVALKLEF